MSGWVAHALGRWRAPLIAVLAASGGLFGAAVALAAVSVNGTATQVGTLNAPASVLAVANNDQTVYVADAYAHEVLALHVATNQETIFAGDGQSGDTGDGSAAVEARLENPDALDVDKWGNVLIEDSEANEVRLVAGESCEGSCPYGLVSLIAGDIYTVAGDGTQTFSRPANGSVANRTAIEQLASYPWTGVDQFGDLMLYSNYDNRDAFLVAGESCPSATLSSCPYGLSSMTAGDIYWLAGNDYAASPGDGNSGNGGPATQAPLESPTGFAVDSSHDLLIADAGTDEIRLVAAHNCSSQCAFGLSSTTAGDIYSLVRFDGEPNELSVDRSGNLLVGDPLNFNVGVIAAADCSSSCPYGLSSMTAGNLYMLEGPSATAASVQGPLAHNASGSIGQPSGLAFDPAGDVFVDDESTNTVYEVQMVAPSSAVGSSHGSSAVSIEIDSVTVKHKPPMVTVTLACQSSSAACSGEVELRELVKLKPRKAQLVRASNAKHKSVTLASASYGLSAGASGTVTAKLTAAGRAALRHASSKAPLHATLTVTVTGGNTVTKSVRLV